MIYYARRKGENYGSDNNKVDNSISGSWTQFGLIEDTDLIIDFQAVLWDCETVGGFLRLRDAYKDEIFYYVADGSRPAVELLDSPMTVRLPLQYFTNISSCSIRIWGKYV